MIGRLKVTAWMTAALLLAGCAANEGRVRTGDIEAVGLARREGIRVVYQIKTADMKGDIGAGLHYVKKLLDAYNSIDIPDAATRVHAVFHGDAGHWMLKDAAYRKASGKESANPNKAVIAELLRRGVSLELCAQTMRSHGWQPDDVLAGVKIVVGAYPRIIDLQQRGFAYIRF